MKIDHVGATALVASPPPIPEQLLGLAQWSVSQTRRPGANETPTLLAIIMIVTAAEAIVNCLLEFNLPARAWKGTDRKRDGVQWKSLAGKFSRLSQVIGMKPVLEKAKSPLKEFLDVVDVRNQLIHFQYTPNIRQVEVGADASYDRGRVRIDVPEIDHEAPGKVIQEAKLYAPLKPDMAPRYYAALDRLLRPVLDACTSDHLGTVARLKSTLDQKEFLDQTPASESGP